MINAWYGVWPIAHGGGGGGGRRGAASHALCGSVHARTSHAHAFSFTCTHAAMHHSAVRCAPAVHVHVHAQASAWALRRDDITCLLTSVASLHDALRALCSSKDHPRNTQQVRHETRSACQQMACHDASRHGMARHDDRCGAAVSIISQSTACGVTSMLREVNHAWRGAARAT